MRNQQIVFVVFFKGKQSLTKLPSMKVKCISYNCKSDGPLST